MPRRIAPPASACYTLRSFANSFFHTGFPAEHGDRRQRHPAVAGGTVPPLAGTPRTAVAPDWRAFFEGFDLARELPAADCELALKTSAVDSLIYRYRDLGHRQAWTNPLDEERPAPPPRPGAGRLRPRSRPTSTAPSAPCATPARPPCATSSPPCTPPTAAPSASSSCTSRNRPSASGSRSGWRPRATARSWVADERLAILARLQEAALFEQFLHRRFLGQKRFSLEGGEALIPLLDALVTRAASAGVTDLVMGMSHRGRLNVLANIFGKPLENIFAEFQDNLELAFVGEGDVKYHQGFSADRRPARRLDPPEPGQQSEPPGGGRPGGRSASAAPATSATAPAGASGCCRC